jgi:hypothetical protein
MTKKSFTIPALCGHVLLAFFLFVTVNPAVADPGHSNKKVSMFGIHAVGLPYFKEVHELGSSIVRIIIATPVWNMIETESGIDFTKLDYAIRTLQKNGMDVVFTIMPNSRKWAAAHLFKKKKGGMEPTVHADLPDRFDQYKKAVGAIVERYDGDGKEDMPGLAFSIDCYQLVNEWVWQWMGSQQTYLKYLKASRDFIKEIHPGARIILGGLTGVEFWAIDKGIDNERNVKLGGMQGSNEPKIMSLESFKNKQPGHVEKMIKRLEFCLTDAKPYFDIIDLHSYTESYKEMIPSVEVIKKYAPEKELWSLENAGPFYRYSPEKHCQELVKRYIVGRYHGIRKIFWSSYNPTGGWSKNFLNLSLIAQKSQKKPAYFVYKFLAFQLSDLRSVEKLNLGSRIEAYKVLKDSGAVYVIWAENGETKVTLPLKGAGEQARLLSFNVRWGRINKVEKQGPIQGGQLIFQVSETPTFVFP